MKRNLNEAGLIQHWMANEMDWVILLPCQFFYYNLNLHFSKVARLDGAKIPRNVDISPRNLSQMLAPFKILLAGFILGFISLLAEVKMVKKINS